VSGVLDEATETWTDLDEMLAAELPPCELTVNGGPRCNAPSVVTLKLRCLGCKEARQAPLCGPCRDTMLRHVMFRCEDCGGVITVRGLS
jgi:tRNA(Ile2) C34 agmatinyltransferase TiaS